METAVAVDLAAALEDARAAVARQVDRALAPRGGIGDAMAAPMRHALQGGKGLRGFLVIEGARLHGFGPQDAAPAAAAIECLHAYSLVHDDLPCMDDDALRRGEPTVHVKWDEATAVLAGDALQSLAFGLLCATGCPDAARIVLLRTLAEAAGWQGMVGGQAADIAAETAGTALDLDGIVAMQAGKTGALLNWAAMAGPRMAGADAGPLGSYGAALGLAFQIADDILDVTGDAARMGKAVGKDGAAGKATFVSLLGLDEARRRAAALVEQACDALALYGPQAGTLRDAARFVIARRN